MMIDIQAIISLFDLITRSDGMPDALRSVCRCLLDAAKQWFWMQIPVRFL